MSQVVKVIRELEIGIINAAGVGRADLSPATKPGTHPVTLAVMGNMALQILLELAPRTKR